jgi:hypothetical protein
MADAYAVILVASTNRALRAEKILKDSGLSCSLIPVPRTLSSDCGVCVRIERADRARAEEAMAAAGLSFDEIHEVR